MTRIEREDPLETLYPVCQLEGGGQKFRLTGFCTKAQPRLDVFYLMMSAVEFVGYLGLSSIAYSPSEDRWEVRSSVDGSELAHRAGIDFPIGSSTWNLTIDNCGATVLKLHLDVPQPGQFCCDDGLCLHSEKVCDGPADCQDFRSTFNLKLSRIEMNNYFISCSLEIESFSSDEQDCEMIKFPRYSYNSERPPVNKVEGDISEQKLTSVSAVVTIIELIELNEADSVFDVFFKIQLEWFDSNLKYSFLKSYNHLNKINSTLAKQIWSPNIKFYLISRSLDSEFENDILVSRQRDPTLVYRDAHPSNSQEKNIGLTYEEIYDGATNPLQLRMDKRKLFSCSFEEIRNYPFGQQECGFHFFIEGTSNQLTNLTADRLIVTQQKNVGQYKVKGWRIRESNYQATEMKGIRVSVILSRDLVSVFMVTYLPTFLMNIINQATNFIVCENRVRVI